jgi:hypothetical protein
MKATPPDNTTTHPYHLDNTATTTPHPHRRSAAPHSNRCPHHHCSRSRRHRDSARAKLPRADPAKCDRLLTPPPPPLIGAPPSSRLRKLSLYPAPLEPSLPCHYYPGFVTALYRLFDNICKPCHHLTINDHIASLSTIKHNPAAFTPER